MIGEPEVKDLSDERLKQIYEWLTLPQDRPWPEFMQQMVDEVIAEAKARGLAGE